MKPVVAILAPGSMGAAIGARLVASGVEVLTSLAERSAVTRERAITAGLRDASDAELLRADLLLSIVPPAAACSVAERISRAAAADARQKPIFVDCNAVSPATVSRIATRVRSAGLEFVDAGLIGGPPRPGSSGPHIYVAGPEAQLVRALARGLTIRVLDAPVGAASALKMSYAGITKGLTAIGSSMILASRRAGVADALHAELGESQPELLYYFARSIPAMYGKAYRWVAEMREIAAFAGSDAAAAAIYGAAAQLYERLAHASGAEAGETAELTAFLEAESLSRRDSHETI